MTVALIDAGATKVIEYRDDSAMNTDQDALADGKPYMVPVVEENAVFNAVTEVRTGPQVIISATQVIWRYTVRAKNTAEVDDMRNSKLAGVRAEADKRLSKIDTFSQSSTSVMRLLQMLYANTDWHSWPQAQVDLATALLSRINKIVQTRVVEDQKQKELQTLTDPAAIAQYDVTTGWPAVPVA